MKMSENPINKKIVSKIIEISQAIEGYDCKRSKSSEGKVWHRKYRSDVKK